MITEKEQETEMRETLSPKEEKGREEQYVNERIK